MAMDIDLVGGTSGNKMEVDANNNGKVTLPLAAQAGAALAYQECAPAADAGGTIRRSTETTADFMQRMGLDTPLLDAYFCGSATSANAIQQDLWKQTATTMAATAGSPNSGYLFLNSTAITTATTGIMYQTYPVYSWCKPFPTYIEFTAKTVNCGTAQNKIVELGQFLATDAKTAGILDGWCLRWLTNGECRLIFSLNGVEVQSSPFTAPSDNVNHRYTFVVNNENLEFWLDNIYQGALAVPTDTISQALQQALPIAMRIYNAGVAPTLGPQLCVARVFASQGSANVTRPIGTIMAGMGQHASNVPYGTAVGETTNQANGNATPAATQAGSNTAPNAAMAGLGGVFQMTAQASNVATGCQMVASYYQVPANSATQASRRLVVTGINISAINYGATVAGTPTTLNWGVAWGHTNVSLATSDAVGAKAPRHLNLGMMSCPIGAIAGTPYSPASVGRQFATPIYVNPGEYFATTVSFPIGTATGSQTVVYGIGVDGYWE